ncbi:FMN-dependent NADH-azoreductase [Paenibacillus yanchengensis]|uniref:FMN dependent NADH:quinone oxidoreductase n=1 Tax=Paenibacillus yanchengensis TaxID=2035833 RepID=A0ABW4YHP8_9BACL
MNVLVVKANNRPADQAISSKMYETFMENFTGVEPVVYDLFAEDTPYFGQQYMEVFGKLATGGVLNEEEQRLMAAKQKAMDVISAADLIVFAFPLWNLSIPAKLQTFIDYIYQSGFTFKYNEQGQQVSLMNDKKVILLNARGGIYSTPEGAGLEMAVNYMRNVVTGVFGMQIVDEVIIEGHNAMPAQAADLIAAGLEKVKEVAIRHSKALVTQ